MFNFEVRLFRDRLRDQESYISEKILEDEHGKYKLITTKEWKYCGCHPETCVHFDGGYYIEKTEKQYIK